MSKLRAEQKEFLARALVGEVVASPPEYALLAHQWAAELAQRFNIVDELRVAAGLRATYDLVREETECRSK